VLTLRPRGSAPASLHGEVSDQIFTIDASAILIVVPLRIRPPRRTCSYTSYAGRIRLRLGFPQPAAADPGPRARVHRWSAPRAVFSPSASTSEVRDAKKKFRPRALCLLRTWGFGAIGRPAATPWTSVAAAGPATRFQDCVVVRERQRLDLTLTQATCIMGRVPRPKPTGLGWAATSCISHGTYVAQELRRLDVDLCRPSFSRFSTRPTALPSHRRWSPGVADPWGHQHRA